MASLSDMVSKGQQKLAAKGPRLAASYDAAKSRAVENYAAVGFGPTRTANYRDGISRARYIAPDPGKWARNWEAKMRE